VILITGGLGFLGCNLAKLLCDGGEKVLLTSNRNANVPLLIAPFLGKCLRVAPLDITSLDSVSRAIQEFRVTSIVHAAVRSEKGDTTLYQAMDVNVTGTINVLEAARRADIRRLLFKLRRSRKKKNFSSPPTGLCRERRKPAKSFA
jgi:nucleoside-diphosphate-sugar epimerase